MPPRLHAIFHRHIPGDEALFRLKQARFAAADVLPEPCPATPDELSRVLAYHPLPGRPISVHLPRSIGLLDERGHDAVCAFAQRFADEASVLVVHDQPEVVSRFDDYVAAVRRLDGRLQKLGRGPNLHIEYAAGLPTEAF